MEGSPRTDTLHGVVSADWTPEAPVALVLFHGYGADERDLAGLGPMLALTVPWASLRAPVTVTPGSYAWFPMFAPEGPDPGRATDAAWQWIDANLAPDAKVAAVGFSQGGFMATQLLRTRPERVAATVVLSGFVQITPQPADERLAAERPAVFWGRGARDRMVTADAIERASQWLPAHSTVTKRVYPDLAHGISDQELDDVRTFLTRQLYAGLPGLPKVKIKSTVMPNAPALFPLPAPSGYWLGGKDHFAADRETADAVEAGWPAVRTGARDIGGKG